ncbi:hypothetical protein CMU89_05800 [Elizabethkingia anophelis]|nr:hypothetical protein [Elizabethkingia anophelis]MDV3542173.1 hypothetical protein [Elizabethkingia anophelis]
MGVMLYKALSGIKMDLVLKVLLIPIILIFLLQFVTLFFIHFNYYQNSKNEVIHFDSDAIMIIKRNNIKEIHKIENLKKIIIHLTDAKKVGRVARTLPSSEYYYSELLFNDNTKVIISCLMVDDLLKFLGDHFSEDMIEYSEEMFPVISKDFPFIFKKK